MRIALFTHHFLEPTHYAIAQILSSVPECTYWVFAKHFSEELPLKVPNVRGRTYYTKGMLPNVTRTSFDLVHAIFDGKTAFRAAGIAAAAGLPFILSFHGGFDIHVRVRDPRYLSAVKTATEFASAITVVCREDVRRLRDVGVNRDITVFPVPVDRSWLPRGRINEATRLISVGRLIPKKGIDLAISAMVELPDRELLIVGDGPLADDLRALAGQLGVANRVHFLGHLPLTKTLDLMAHSFALVHPARVARDGNAEGTPQVILWAQALGLPVITTDTGSIPEILVHGDTGIIVGTEDPLALADAIHSIARDDGLRARLNAPLELEDHAISKTRNELLDIYRKACTAQTL